jgi:hypothetical protein
MTKNRDATTVVVVATKPNGPAPLASVGVVVIVIVGVVVGGMVVSIMVVVMKSVMAWIVLRPLAGSAQLAAKKKSCPQVSAVTKV